MIPRQRALWVIMVLSVGFTLISYRLVQIQVVEYDKYRRMAIENHCVRIILPARRGMILYCNQQSLAQSQTLYEVRLDGANVREPAATLAAMEKIVHLDPGTLTANFNPQARYLLVSNSATEEMVNQLKDFEKQTLQAWSGLPEVKAKKITPQAFLSINDFPLRAYPNGMYASHLLGFLDANQHGVTGVESVMDSDLAGIPGERWIEKDVRGHEIAAYRGRDQLPVDGFNVVLTIDSSVQHIIEEGLDKIVAKYQPNGAYVICMQPNTGEILGMANRPTFDPNNRRGVPLDHFRNRCLTDMVEPGSVFKIVTLAGALNERLFGLDSEIYCENGKFFYADSWLHDDEPYGLLTVEEVLAHSSNIGFAKMGLELGDSRLYDYARRFGFGEATHLLPHQGESSGLLRPLSRWSKLSVTRVPMGQEVGATPMQMACAMSVIANRGRLVVPRLIKEVTDADGHVVRYFPPQVVHQVISSETACLVSKALAAVVTEGTAKDVKFPPGYNVAGKTGTAQVFINGAYSKDKHVASFIGYLPEENPAFVLLVMVDQPKTKDDYGAEVAAPAWSEMAGQIVQVLNIQPNALPAEPVPVQKASL
jgi:cell division protein FtsI (penicillin-binding protein 3)/stage V sporulation protein D (sporulation-specific penicillin-binding protein)